MKFKPLTYSLLLFVLDEGVSLAKQTKKIEGLQRFLCIAKLTSNL